MATYEIQMDGIEPIIITGGPGTVRKAVETVTGMKFRGRANITPQIAKLEEGDVLVVDGGASIALVAKGDDDEEDDENEDISPIDDDDEDENEGDETNGKEL